MKQCTSLQGYETAVFNVIELSMENIDEIDILHNKYLAVSVVNF